MAQEENRTHLKILYNLMIHYVHSELEMLKDKLIVNEQTTVENFETASINKQLCLDIFNKALSHYNYELSYNQFCNGVHLFLESHKIKKNRVIPNVPENETQKIQFP